MSEEFARRRFVVPLDITPEGLVVATADETDRATLRELAQLTQRRIIPVLATREAIHQALNRLFGGPPEEEVPYVPLGELLLQLRYVSFEQLRQGLARQGQTGELLGGCLVILGYLSEQDLTQALALQLRVPHLRLRRIHPALGFILPGQFMMEHMVVPIKVEGRTLIIATTNPWDRVLFVQIEALTGLRVRPVLSSRDEIWETIGKLHYAGPRVPFLQPEVWGKTAVQLGYLTPGQLSGAKVLSERTGESLEEALERLGFLAHGQILELKAKSLDVGYRPLRRPRAANGLRDLIPIGISRRYEVIALERRNGTLALGMVHPGDREAIELVEAISALTIQPVLVDHKELESRLETLASLPPRRDLELAKRSIEWYLLHLGYVDESQLDRARRLAAESPKGLETCLLELGYIDEVDLREVLSLQTGYPHMSLEHYPPTAEMRQMIPGELMLRFTVLPVRKHGEYLMLAMANPLSGKAIAAVAEATGLEVLPVVATSSQISAILDRFFLADVLQMDEDVRRFAEHLVDEGYFSHSQLILALREIAAGKGELDQVLVRLGLMPEGQFASLVSEYLGLPQVDLGLEERVEMVLDAVGQPVERSFVTDPVDEGVARLLEEAQARAFGALPIAEGIRHITVALAEPLSGAKLERLTELLGKAIRPVVALPSQLEDAIQRILGRRTIGNYLLMADLINQQQLRDALDLAERTGVRVGRALISRGYITEDQLYSYLAEQQGLPFFDLTGAGLDGEVARVLPEELGRRLGCLPLSMDAEEIIVAMIDPLDSAAVEAAEEATGRKVRPVVITEQDFQAALEDIYQEDYLVRSTSELLYRMPENSAYVTLTRTQITGVILILLASAIGVALNHVLYFTVVNALATVFYVAFCAHKFYLVYRALSHTLEIEVTPEEVAALDERNLPVYTILVPLYREAEVLPSLIEALRGLDYPPTKLDIKILLEEDDNDTIEALNRLHPPSHFHSIIVPSSPPKTKPKACNYGLIHAKGEYTVIYDAEDLPEPDQLKKIQLAFAKADPRVVCIQCKLNYYNRHQNIITRWFTTEYSMWFDLFLPGLDASNSPIPLGGTSNHFKTLALKEVGAWDPFNVTEDADLGVRLFKAGYRTAIVDSTTFEEANSELYNWVRQRSRWIKGYIQTWLVHMRHPLRLMRSIGFLPWLSFQFVVGGTVFGALMNPVYWTLTALWFLSEWGLIQEVFPLPSSTWAP